MSGDGEKVNHVEKKKGWLAKPLEAMTRALLKAGYGSDAHAEHGMHDANTKHVGHESHDPRSRQFGAQRVGGPIHEEPAEVVAEAERKTEAEIAEARNKEVRKKTWYALQRAVDNGELGENLRGRGTSMSAEQLTRATVELIRRLKQIQRYELAKEIKRDQVLQAQSPADADNAIAWQILQEANSRGELGTLGHDASAQNLARTAIEMIRKLRSEGKKEIGIDIVAEVAGGDSDAAGPDAGQEIYQGIYLGEVAVVEKPAELSDTEKLAAIRDEAHRLADERITSPWLEDRDKNMLSLQLNSVDWAIDYDGLAAAERELERLINGIDLADSMIASAMSMDCHKRYDALDRIFSAFDRGSPTWQELVEISTQITSASLANNYAEVTRLHKRFVKLEEAVQYGETDIGPDISAKQPAGRGVEWKDVHRATEVMAIGDLHGSWDAYTENLRSLGVIDRANNWIGGDRRLVFHGDILADRDWNGVRILTDIARLREQAHAAGGEISVLAGNHEDFMLQFLLGEKKKYTEKEFKGEQLSGVVNGYIGGQQGMGLLELGHYFGSAELKGMLPGQARGEATWQKLAEEQEAIFGKMVVDNHGREILGYICEMKIAEQIDDTLFVHTNPTAAMMHAIVQYGVDAINQQYQAALRTPLLLDNPLSADDKQKLDSIRAVFLNTNNRENFDTRNEAAIAKGFGYDTPADLANALRAKGVNHIVYGHTDEFVKVLDIHGITLVNIDDSAFKNGADKHLRSIAKLDTDGTIHRGVGLPQVDRP